MPARLRVLPFWGQRAPAFRHGGEWPSPLPLLEHPCSTACMRTGDDPVWGGLRASALCTPCRVFGAFRWASRQRVQQARYTPFASMLAIHPDASSFRRTPGKSLGIMSFSREAPGFSHGECHVAAFAPDDGERLGEVEATSKDSVLSTALVPLRYPTSQGTETAVEFAINPLHFHDAFAADLPAEQAAVMAATQRPVAELAFSEPSEAPAWKTLPTWAVVASGDKPAGSDVIGTPSTVTSARDTAGPPCASL